MSNVSVLSEYKKENRLSLRIVTEGSMYENNEHVTDFFDGFLRETWHWGDESPERARNFMMQFESSLMVFLNPELYSLSDYYTLQNQFDVYHSIFVPEDIDL